MNKGEMKAVEFYAKYKGKYVKYIGRTSIAMGIVKGRKYRVLGCYKENDRQVMIQADTPKTTLVSQHQQVRFKVKTTTSETRAWAIDVSSLQPLDVVVADTRVLTEMGEGRVVKVDRHNMCLVEFPNDSERLYEFRQDEVVEVD